MTEQWVRKILKNLEAKKYIVVIGKNGQSKQYSLRICSDLNSDTETQFRNGDQTETQFRQTETQFRTNRNSVSPNHINEPDKEPNKEPKTKNKNLARAREDCLTAQQSNLPVVDEKKISAAEKVKAYEADYERFYQAYPKPKNPDKTPGRKKYIALRQHGISADDLLKAAENYAIANRTTPPQYIKRIATFLGPQEAWRDFVSHERETPHQQELSGEAEYMRDALGAGLISQDDYDKWRRKINVIQ